MPVNTDPRCHWCGHTMHAAISHACPTLTVMREMRADHDAQDAIRDATAVADADSPPEPCQVAGKTDLGVLRLALKEKMPVTLDALKFYRPDQVYLWFERHREVDRWPFTVIRAEYQRLMTEKQLVSKSLVDVG